VHRLALLTDRVGASRFGDECVEGLGGRSVQADAEFGCELSSLDGRVLERGHRGDPRRLQLGLLPERRIGEVE